MADSPLRPYSPKRAGAVRMLPENPVAVSFVDLYEVSTKGGKKGISL